MVTKQSTINGFAHHRSQMHKYSKMLDGANCTAPKKKQTHIPDHYVQIIRKQGNLKVAA